MAVALNPNILDREESPSFRAESGQSEVQYTVLERSDSIKVTDLPEDAPVLVGHMILEALDLCVDIENGLIYNPAHDGEWRIKIL